MGIFCQFFTELSDLNTNIFHFWMIVSIYQWIFTKLGMCIAIMEIWFKTAIGKFGQFLTELSAQDTSIFPFQDNNFSKSQWIFTQLNMCIDIVAIWFGIAIGYVSSIFDRAISP